jgi:hypothetical protein
MKNKPINGIEERLWESLKMRLSGLSTSHEMHHEFIIEDILKTVQLIETHSVNEALDREIFRLENYDQLPIQVKMENPTLWNGYKMAKYDQILHLKKEKLGDKT